MKTATTDEEKRIAIAEYCGWRMVEQKWPSKPYNRTAWVLDGKTQSIGVDHPPDFLNSLDAMHEVTKILTREQQDRFIDNLLLVIVVPVEAEYGPLGDQDTTWILVHATARQRAEAFLKTIQQP